MRLGQMRIQDFLDVAVPIESESEADDPDNAYEHEGRLYEEIRVWNHLNVTMAHQVRGGNPVHEFFPGSSSIEIGGSGPEPDYVTAWVAEELWHEHKIDLGLWNDGESGTDEFDIEVVDIESDEVGML